MACPRSGSAPLYAGGSARPVRRGFDYIPRDCLSCLSPYHTVPAACEIPLSKRSAYTRPVTCSTPQKGRCCRAATKRPRCRAPLMDRFLRTTLAPLATIPPSASRPTTGVSRVRLNERPLRGRKIRTERQQCARPTGGFRPLCFGPAVTDRPPLPRYGESTARL